jgi:hypothetical protein
MKISDDEQFEHSIIAISSDFINSKPLVLDFLSVPMI